MTRVIYEFQIFLCRGVTHNTHPSEGAGSERHIPPAYEKNGDAEMAMRTYDPKRP